MNVSHLFPTVYIYAVKMKLQFAEINKIKTAPKMNFIYIYIYIYTYIYVLNIGSMTVSICCKIYLSMLQCIAQ